MPAGDGPGARCSAASEGAGPARDVPVPPVPGGFDIRDHVSGLGAHLAGPANVVMQLSRPAVGHAVLNSRVPSGSAVRHPFRRTRTTFTYLAVALLGDEGDRDAMRRAVNRQHAQVYSRPGEPVGYRASDPDLQTWIAACLYRGTADVIATMHGPLPDAEADALYAHCARFGTTLQMPSSAWPTDRAAFARYWQDAMAETRIDPAVAAYLRALIGLRHLPAPLRLLAPFVTFVTAGFLPPPFRRALGLPWDERRQRRFARLMRVVGAVDRRLPRPVRNFPLNAWLADLRLRRRFHRPLL